MVEAGGTFSDMDLQLFGSILWQNTWFALRLENEAFLKTCIRFKNVGFLNIAMLNCPSLVNGTVQS